MSGEVAITEGVVDFTEPIGEFRVSRNALLEMPWLWSQYDVEKMIIDEAIKRGLMVNIDYDIITCEWLIRWKPDPRAQMKPPEQTDL